jgi:RNA recognition motif-containing protein
MGEKLRVGNLPFSVTNKDRVAKFIPSGNVQFADVVRDQHTGRSKRYGFIKMATYAQAQAAIRRLIRLLNFFQYDGLTIGVNAVRS